MTMPFRRVSLPSGHPAPTPPPTAPRWLRDDWLASWIVPDDHGDAPQVWAFRLRVVSTGESVLFHVAAHERYELFIDGEFAGRGSERGCREWCHYESYELTLSPGEHVIVARVWWLGDHAPYAQMSPRGGFLAWVEPVDDASLLRFATGHAPWEAMVMAGYRFHRSLTCWGTGSRETLDAAMFPWGFARGEGTGWQRCTRTFKARNLESAEGHEFPVARPAALPPQFSGLAPAGRVRHLSAPASSPVEAIPLRAEDHLAAEVGPWNALLAAGAAVIVPAGIRRRIVIDLDGYFCVYPHLTVSGGRGASVRIAFSEGMFADALKNVKPHRDEIEGHYFRTLTHQVGDGDTLIADGGAARSYHPLWWRAGRYVEVLVETADAPLTLERLVFEETHYPLEPVASFSASDPRLERFIPIGWRSLLMCMHETYVDCPFYEQLMYVGDTRVEILLSLVWSGDERLPRKSLELFDASRSSNGLTASRYPSRYRQTIPPFSLWWIGMVHDALLWGSDPDYALGFRRGVRAVLDAWGEPLPGGFYASPRGWNYHDWVVTWSGGEPPTEPDGTHALLQWQLLLAYQYAADLEAAAGDERRAADYRARAAALGDALVARTWSAQHGLFATSGELGEFAEHAQCLAVLAGVSPAGHREAFAAALSADLADGGLRLAPKTSIYFSHYLLEALRVMGDGDLILRKLEEWFALESTGLRTTYENNTVENTRSDCHAWGAHPLFHYHCSLAGIRPLGPGFRRVQVRPLPGPLSHLRSEIPHPAGRIRVECQRHGDEWEITVDLPSGIEGELVWGDLRRPLPGGRTTARFQPVGPQA